MNQISTPIAPAINDKIAESDFPCLMAKKVFTSGRAHRMACGDMADISAPHITSVLKHIYHAVDAIHADSQGYHSIVLDFSTIIRCEMQFETLLWGFLQALHDLDKEHYSWDKNVSSDPKSASFSFSLKGEAFYVIGLHPLSSRKARRMDNATLVMNLHSQFEKLRDTGSYQMVRDRIRSRDVAYSGSVNPMLEDFGKTSEATQYSGRAFDKESWKCPFKENH